MNIKNLTFKQKNNLLWGIGTIALLLCWFLAFGKTYERIKKVGKLGSLISKGGNDGVLLNDLVKKKSLQDSLIRTYSADSTEWTSNLLAEVGSLVSGINVEISYSNVNIDKSKNFVGREMIFSGSGGELEKVLKKLESRFFLNWVRFYEEEGKLRMGVKLGVLGA